MKSSITAYQYTLDATYNYMVKNHGQDLLIPFKTKVKVIGESPKCYKIRLLEPIRNHMVGDEILVHKKSIALDTPNPNHEKKTYWWDEL